MNLKQKIGLIKSLLIYNYKPFNKHRLKKFYSHFINKDDLCFDIGAHTGNRTGTWLRLGAKVVSVEPQPVFCKLLKRKFGKHPGFILLDKAVSNQIGKAKLKISSLNPTLSTLSPEWKNVIHEIDDSVKWDDELRVSVTTIDELIKKYGLPVFCKIDVEGLEDLVLRGNTHTIPMLSFEFFPTTPHQTLNCLDIISSWGRYEYNWVFVETFKFNSPNWVMLDTIKDEIINYKGNYSGDIYARLIS